MLWGGRFKSGINSEALRFSSSIDFDVNLFEEDLLVSKAHSEMLHKIGILTEDEFKTISLGLDKIKTEFSEGAWKTESGKFEDIHSAIESRLTELIGKPAGKLHTGRSRNDQVATDEKLWIKKAAAQVLWLIEGFQKTLVAVAEKHIETIIPGYTHLQRAQPVSFAFHLLAYTEMLERDKARFQFVFGEADYSPLGAGALAGSTLPLDREFTSEKLGFAAPTRNALDTVSDRDYIIDFLHAASVGMMHLSRLSEELILWTSSEWRFVKLPDEFTTGSSLMPQKKNPDMAELIRGKVGRVYGNYFTLVTVLKGLPLSYNRDLQEDKEPLFDSFLTYCDALSLMNKMIAGIDVDTERFTGELKKGFSLATDLADWLVLQGIPFREAHHIVGELVRYCEDNGKFFDSLTLPEMQNINPVFTSDALESLTIENSLKRKKTFGSPNPQLVKEQIKFWKKKLA